MQVYELMASSQLYPDEQGELAHSSVSAGNNKKNVEGVFHYKGFQNFQLIHELISINSINKLSHSKGFPYYRGFPKVYCTLPTMKLLHINWITVNASNRLRF